jgi:YVTN family beta-propeller protein
MGCSQRNDRFVAKHAIPHHEWTFALAAGRLRNITQNILKRGLRCAQPAPTVGSAQRLSGRFPPVNSTKICARQRGDTQNECRIKDMPAEVPINMANVLMPPAALEEGHVQPAAEARLLGSIAVHRGPIADIAFDGTKIVATNSGDESVAVLNAHTLQVEADVPVAGEPFAVTTVGDRAFVAASAPTHDLVSAIDTRAEAHLASLPLDLHVVSIAAGLDGRRLFVSGTGPDTADLAIIDVESGRVDTVAVADVDSIVGAVRVASNGRVVYVATSDTQRGKLTVIDAANARIVGVVPTVSPIQDFALSDDGTVVYVLGRDPEYGGVVYTIDTARKRVLASAWIGGHPTQFALGVDGSRLYIVDVDRVAVLCTITNEIVDGIEVGAHASCVATSPDGARLVVADYSGALTAFALPTQSSFGDLTDPATRAMVQELEPAV